MKMHRRCRVAGVAAGGGARNFYSRFFGPQFLYSVFFGPAGVSARNMASCSAVVLALRQLA